MPSANRGPALLLLVWFSISWGCTMGEGSVSGVARRAKVVVTVRFKSHLDADEIRRRYPQRMPEFRKLEGLVQKFYLHDPETDEWSGIYFWDSMASVQEYLNSDLRKTIPSAYGVVGTPRVEVFEIVEVLR